MGFNWIEFDVQLTNDNFAIIIHDDTLSRTTNTKDCDDLLVYNTVNIIEKLNVENTDYKVPLLSDIKKLYTTSASTGRVVLNIELKVPYNLKPTTSRYKQYVNDLVITTKNEISNWPNNFIPLISSFDWNILLKTDDIFNHNIYLGFLSEYELNKEQLTLINNVKNKNKTRVLSISLDKQVILQKNNIALYKHYVDIILIYTVNDYCEYKYLIENGVDGPL